ncbi:helix-turn-helix domain-containing protein [Microbacterium sp. CJ77]|uniref:helix-turn-helix domain-containing protein n=1 Tax=Microbacterium sp. CJ77 TaxID=2079201 RepID=UPI000CD91DBF|nr:helix-turn-helix transcriptional regulator [Microbacterium sp. CJ77]
MQPLDTHIGANLSQLRGAMTQKDLAERMRQLGHKWSQATVWSVEKGERPLRLTEALSLVGVLNTQISVLVADPNAVAVNRRAELERLQTEIERLTFESEKKRSASQGLEHELGVLAGEVSQIDMRLARLVTRRNLLAHQESPPDGFD